MMEIQELKVNELKNLYGMAQMFCDSSSFLNKFDPLVFERSWTNFINSGNGIIYGLINNGSMVGAIGGLKFNDPNTGDLIASELFWFVHPEYRGEGIRLLRRFEDWAKRKGCKRITMVYLSDLMPEEVRKIYEWRKYKMMEVHYIKEVS